MDQYKEASRLQLRFSTSKGSLSVEQMWSLKTTELSVYLKSLNEEIKRNSSANELSFLTEAVPTQHDIINELRFNIAKDIYVTKKADADAARTAKEDKEYNEKILGLINEKQDGELRGKSVEELRAMLKQTA